MHYIIDGHNLIPCITGLDLSMVDDEEQLLKRLQGFCQQGGHQVEVFFDGSPADYAGTRRWGRITAHYVRSSSSADQAIRKRLNSLRRAARNWAVVSSDLQVQAAARQAHCQVVRGEEFARLLQESRHTGGQMTGDSQPEQALDEAEIEEWLRLFQKREPKQKG